MIRPPTRQPIKKRTHKAMKKRDHAYIPPRSADRLRLQPRAGTRAQCPHALASLPSTDANAWLPRIVAIGNGRPRRFRRQHREYPAAYAPLASGPRSSNPHSRARKTAPTSPRFPPWEAFERRPRRTPNRRKGRRPKPFTGADVPETSCERVSSTHAGRQRSNQAIPEPDLELAKNI